MLLEKKSSTFTASFKRLNHIPTGRTQVTPIGRVFMLSSSGYLGPIHTRLVGENPVSHEDIIDELEKSRNLHGKLYAGTGGLINLTYISKAKASSAILFDVNSAQTVFWDSLILAIKKNPKREDMIKYMLACAYDEIDKKIENACTRFPLARPSTLFRTFGETKSGRQSIRHKELTMREIKKWLLQESARLPEGKWLHNNELYAHLHNMALRGAIGSLTIDVADTEAWKQLSEHLKKLNSPVKKIGLLYLSNVMNFYRPCNDTDFIGRKINSQEDPLRIRRNLGLCLAPKAKVIECDNKDRPILLGSSDDYFSSLDY